MGVLTPLIRKNLDVADATFARPDLSVFCRLDQLGLEVTGQRLEPERAVLACRVEEPDRWCSGCGCEGTARDSVVRRLAHEPLGWRPTTLEMMVRRHRQIPTRDRRVQAPTTRWIVKSHVRVKAGRGV